MERLGRKLTLLVLISWFVDDRTVFEASQVEHAHATVSTTADEDINTVSAESNVVNLLVVSD